MKNIFLLSAMIILSACASPQVTATSTPLPTDTPAPTLTPTPVAIDGIAQDSESNFLVYQEESQTWTILPKLDADFDRIIVSDDGSVVAVDKYGVETYGLSVAGEWEAIVFDLQTFLQAKQDEITQGRSWDEYLATVEGLKNWDKAGVWKELQYSAAFANAKVEQLVVVPVFQPGAKELGIDHEALFLVTMRDSPRLLAFSAAEIMSGGRFVPMLPVYEGVSKFGEEDDIVFSNVESLKQLEGKVVQFRILMQYVDADPEVWVEKLSKDKGDVMFLNQVTRRGGIDNLRLFAEIVSNDFSVPKYFSDVWYRDNQNRAEGWQRWFLFLEENPQFNVILVDWSASDKMVNETGDLEVSAGLFR